MRRLLVLSLIISSTLFAADDLKLRQKHREALVSKDSKAIIVKVEGSDWCGPCKSFDKYVVNKAKYQNLIKKLKLKQITVDYPKVDIREGLVGLQNNYMDNFGRRFPNLIIITKDGIEEILYDKKVSKDNFRVLKSRDLNNTINGNPPVTEELKRAYKELKL